MKKQFFVQFACVFCFFCFPVDGVYCKSETPVDFIREFYTWYMENIKDIKSMPIYNDKIYEYVYTCTVNRLRSDLHQGNMDTDYFLKTQDFDYDDDAPSLKVYDAIGVHNSLFLVPVGKEKPYLLVFVQRTSEGWRIIKVEDARFGP